MYNWGYIHNNNNYHWKSYFWVNLISNGGGGGRIPPPLQHFHVSTLHLETHCIFLNIYFLNLETKNLNFVWGYPSQASLKMLRFIFQKMTKIFLQVTLFFYCRILFIRLSFSQRACGYYPQEIWRTPQEMHFGVNLKLDHLGSNHQAKQGDLLPICLSTYIAQLWSDFH